MGADMTTRSESTGRYLRPLVLVPALAILAGTGACAQQFAKQETSSVEDCMASLRSGTTAEASRCDHQAIAELAHSGQAFSQNELGVESALVVGENRTIKDARRWFEKAAQQGYAPAQVNLAILYLNGWGGPQNYGAALYWLKAAAKSGNARAHTNLGILYLDGLGVRQDYDEALRHFRIAAEQGEVVAMVNLGFMSDKGLGTPKNQVSAADWYRQAAERGDAVGQNNLADMYLRGEGVSQNGATALGWFQKAARQGHTGAQIKLGFLYLAGLGTPKDREAAYSWIFAASLAGDDRGKEYLTELEKTLTSEQLARAKDKARILYETVSPSAVETAFVH